MLKSYLIVSILHSSFSSGGLNFAKLLDERISMRTLCSAEPGRDLEVTWERVAEFTLEFIQ